MIEGSCQRKSSVWKVRKGRRVKWTVHIEPTKGRESGGANQWICVCTLKIEQWKTAIEKRVEDNQHYRPEGWE